MGSFSNQTSVQKPPSKPFDTYDEPYSSYPEWDGFKIVSFIECPTALEEMIKEKVVKIKAEKQKQSRIDFKEKADKTDKKIIAELEL